jgi:hypothetical protein
MILATVLRPWPSELMEAHEVSTLVNSPENDTAECIQPVTPSQTTKPQLPLPSEHAIQARALHNADVRSSVRNGLMENSVQS